MNYTGDADWEREIVRVMQIPSTDRIYASNWWQVRYERMAIHHHHHSQKQPPLLPLLLWAKEHYSTSHLLCDATHITAFIGCLPVYHHHHAHLIFMYSLPPFFPSFQFHSQILLVWYFLWVTRSIVVVIMIII